jgi:hypothetical protein
MVPCNTFPKYSSTTGWSQAEAICKITKTLGFHRQKRYYYSPQSLQTETFPPFFSASKHSLPRIPRWHHHAPPDLSPLDSREASPRRQRPSPGTDSLAVSRRGSFDPGRLPSCSGIRENHLLLVLAGGVPSISLDFGIYEVATSRAELRVLKILGALVGERNRERLSVDGGEDAGEGAAAVGLQPSDHGGWCGAAAARVPGVEREQCEDFLPFYSGFLLAQH